MRRLCVRRGAPATSCSRGPPGVHPPPQLCSGASWPPAARPAGAAPAAARLRPVTAPSAQKLPPTRRALVSLLVAEALAADPRPGPLCFAVPPLAQCLAAR